MHNMIVEDESEELVAALQFENVGDPIDLPYHNLAIWRIYSNALINAVSSNSRTTEEKNLIEHLWAIKGVNNVGT